MIKGQEKQVSGCPDLACLAGVGDWGKWQEGRPVTTYVNAFAKAQNFSLPDFLTSIVAPGHPRLPSYLGWTQYWLMPGEGERTTPPVTWIPSQ